MRTAFVRIKNMVSERQEDEYFEKMTLRLQNDQAEEFIIPPLMKKLLELIARNEGLSVEYLCRQVMQRKKPELEPRNALQVFIHAYLIEAINVQCSECPEL